MWPRNLTPAWFACARVSARVTETQDCNRNGLANEHSEKCKWAVFIPSKCAASARRLQLALYDWTARREALVNPVSVSFAQRVIQSRGRHDGENLAACARND